MGLTQKVIPHFFTERACLKLVFSALWKISQRWQRVAMTGLERQQLALLRRDRTSRQPNR